jgi:hypothetical protein
MNKNLARPRVAWLVPVAFTAMVVLPTGTVTSSAAEKSGKLLLTAFAVDMNRTGAGAARSLDIAIERWSTDQEVSSLRDALVNKGGDALLSALQKIKPRVGYIRGAMSLGWDLYYARELPTDDGGRRILFATDRPLSFREARERPRSADYEFTLGEIRLDKDGKGEGKLVPAAKVKYVKATHTVEIENYQIVPVHLNDVHVSEPGSGKK